MTDSQHDPGVDDPATTADPTTVEDDRGAGHDGAGSRSRVEARDAHEHATDGTADAPASDDASGAAQDGHGSDAAATPPARGMLVERAAAMGVQPAPPPKRTGIFVDVDELREHVGGLLRAMLGGYEVDALGNFTFIADGARVFVTVGPGPMGPHIGVFSIVTVDLPLTPDLAAFLLTTNNRMAFGAFSYEPDQRAVWLRHSLLGAMLDAPELRSAVISIAATAGKAIELLRERFGAGSFTDASVERQQAVRPPGPASDADDDGGAFDGYL